MVPCSRWVIPWVLAVTVFVHYIDTDDLQVGMLSLVAGAWWVALLMAGLSLWLAKR